MNPLMLQIGKDHGLSFKQASPLAGGDINEVFKVIASEGDFVIKRNAYKSLPGMFEAESKGLQLLQSTNTFVIPEVLGVGQIEDYGYLLLAFLPSGKPAQNFWEKFGTHLAHLHTNSQSHFGLDHDNFIGSLPQYNTAWETASAFYIHQRLEPQLKWAHDHGYPFSSLNSFYKNIAKDIPKEASSLVHGDLWNGNYLVTKNGTPALIDPAVAYAPREMDLAMMQLFGGFPEATFNTYQEVFPLEPGWKKRVPLWQLYYLLVHLNLFGKGYYPSVKKIIQQFS